MTEARNGLPVVSVGLLLSLAMLASPAPARASAWTYDPGHFYLQIGTAFSYADRRYLSDGSLAPILVPKLSTNPAEFNASNYQQLLTDLYFEVGALPRVTVFGNLGLISARDKNPGGDIVYSTNSLGDLMLGMRGGILQKPVALALEVRLGFPTGDARRSLPTSSGDFHGELRFALSHAFTLLPIYFDFEFGLLMRGAGRVYDVTSSSPDHTSLVNFSPQMTMHSEIGGRLLRLKSVERLRLILGVDYVGSTTKSGGADATLLLYPENSELTTLSASLMGSIYRSFGALLRAARTVEGLRQPELSTFGVALYAQW